MKSRMDLERVIYLLDISHHFSENMPKTSGKTSRLGFVPGSFPLRSQIKISNCRLLQLEDHNLLIETGPITPISINANGDKITCQSPLCQRFVIVFNFFIGLELPQNVTDITINSKQIEKTSYDQKSI